jgi:outer membrane biosynthesis protein TonB
VSHPLHELAPAPGTRTGQVLGVLAALALHTAVTLTALHCQPTQASAPLSVTEVDLMPVELPAPEPEPVPEPAPEPEPEPEKAPAPRPQPRSEKPAPAPPPAAAGALHTAREDTPDPAEPVRFAVDPNGGAYGFGVVAAGGSRSGQAGGSGKEPSALPSPGPATPERGERPRAFAVPPRLDESDPCRGFFPTGASVDRGEVTVSLRIGSDGAVQRVSVQREEPLGQGFGASATRCLKGKRFVPARDENDREVTAEAPVTVRFSR